MAQVTKTILDVLLERNRITQAEAVNFPKTFNNLEIEKNLRQTNSVSSEDIAKAYALLYDLPFIRLENYNVSPPAVQLIPRDVIEKYFVLAFEQDGNIPGGKVKIALGNPGDLKNNPPQVLDDLRQKKSVQVDLYITTPEDIKNILRRFPPTPPVSQVPQVSQLSQKITNTPPGLKSVDLKNIKIPYQVITKFPIDISKKYHMVVFDNPTPSLIKVAVSDPYNPKIQEILDFVRQKNEIAIEEFVANPDDIAEAIKLYYKKPEPIPEPPKIEHKAEPKHEEKKEEKKPEEKEHVPSIFQKIKHPEPEKKEEKKEEDKKDDEAKFVSQLEKPRFVQKPASEPVAETKEDDEAANKISTEAPETDLDKFLGQEVKDVETLKQIAETGNVPQILAASVALAVLKKASDIHIEPEEEILRIRFRIDGVLKEIIKLPLELCPAIISRIKILSRLKIDEQRVPQDGRFDAQTHGHLIDLRVSTLPTVRGEKAALRILDKSQNIFTLEQLGISGRGQKVLEENITKPYGIILSTGPTGSGKSTTLYSILHKIANPQVNVITLEDPVEYEIPGINQCQVKPKIGFSFAEGLRSVLRQDPNIIMVGEIRDAETAGMATHAALTGHLVLSTLHTNDAAGALPRLINMGIEPFLITSSVNVIIGQRLVRKICQNCKKEFQIPGPLMADIIKELEGFNLPKPYKFYHGEGCSQCNMGFSGRIGVYEVLKMTDKIEELAVKKRPASEILEAAIAGGMVTMKQDGLIKALKGITTVSEVLRVTTSG